MPDQVSHCDSTTPSHAPVLFCARLQVRRPILIGMTSIL
ncbi:MAG: hypothetical protein JWR02_1557 [Mucilaginibacter sp.]|nr:hypothetical protein [Mucilaginibacter sp.]